MMLMPARMQWRILSVMIMLGQAALAATPSPEDGFNSGVIGGRALAIQNDGKILTHDGSTLLIRLNSDGSRDTSFNCTIRSFSQSIVLQADGKILVPEVFMNPESLVRLNVDGSIDTSFDADYLTEGEDTVKLIKLHSHLQKSR